MQGYTLAEMHYAGLLAYWRPDLGVQIDHDNLLYDYL